MTTQDGARAEALANDNCAKHLYEGNRESVARRSGFMAGYSAGYRQAVEDCIKQLGGRYGAAARKDLMCLLPKEGGQ